MMRKSVLIASPFKAKESVTGYLIWDHDVKVFTACGYPIGVCVVSMLSLVVQETSFVLHGDTWANCLSLKCVGYSMG